MWTLMCVKRTGFSENFRCSFLLLLVACWSMVLLADEKQQSLEKFVEQAFDRNNANIETHALILSLNGKIILEKYAPGRYAESQHHSWSMAKSVGSLLIGAAIGDGLLHLDHPIHSYFKDPLLTGCAQGDDWKRRMTLEHLLTMSSGIDFKETYESGPFYSHVVSMLYGLGRSDMGAYAWCLPQAYEPGVMFSYASGDSNIAMLTLSQVMSPSRYEDYPWKKLFDPMNITATWERDHRGIFVASSWLYLRPIDFWKFGQLVLDGGQWQGQQLVPASFIKWMLSTAAVFNHPFTIDKLKQRSYESPILLYGGSWWMNRPQPLALLEKAYKTVNDDVVLMLGHQGQLLAIFPSLGAVVLRLATDYTKDFDREAFLHEVQSYVSALKVEQRQQQQLKPTASPEEVY